MKPQCIDPRYCNITSNMFTFRIGDAKLQVGGTGQYLGFHKGANPHLIPLHPLFNQKNIGTVFESLHNLHADFLKEHNLFIDPKELPPPIEPVDLPDGFDVL